MSPTVYICTGSCNGVATADEFDNGARTCASEVCEKHGKPLEARIQCEGCEKAGPRQACHNCSVPEGQKQ